MAKHKRIVAVGPAEEVRGLKAAGVEVVDLDNASALARTLDPYLADEETAMIIVSEALLEGESDFATITAMRRKTHAVVLVVPSYLGSKNLTFSYMKQMLQQSIGVDLISER